MDELGIESTLSFTGRQARTVDPPSDSPAFQFLREHCIGFEIVPHPAGVRSARSFAEAIGVPDEQIVKCVLLESDQGVVLCLVSTDQRVDLAKVGAAMELDNPRLASREQTAHITGFAPGIVTPFGLRRELSICADWKVRQLGEVYLGAGVTSCDIRVSTTDLVTALPIRWLDIAEE